MRGPKSLTFRLTALFALVSTAVLLLLGLAVAAAVERHFEELDAETLRGNLVHARQDLEKAGTPEALQSLWRHLEDSLDAQPGVAMIVRTADGRMLFATRGIVLPDAATAPPSRNAQRSAIWSAADGRSYRVIAGTARTRLPDMQPVVVVAALAMQQHEHFIGSFRTALWSVVGIAAALTGLLGWIAARRGLAPLKTIRQSAAGITANRLDYRLSPESIPEELAEVVQTLNEMLARLQKSFRRLSDFSSDLAHELRTPVGNLLTQTQVILSQPRSPEAYRETLTSNGEELERLARTVSDMLFLAKADNNLIVPDRQRIELSREVADVLEFYDALAAEKDLRLTASGAGSVYGDRLMLRRALSNLLSNAIRHTPRSGSIVVAIASSDGMATLSVENNGDTIPPEHLSRLFDRFYRASASRQRVAEGAGLGLAITQSIVRAHGGTISVRSSDGVTRFEIRLPAATEAATPDAAAATR